MAVSIMEMGVRRVGRKSVINNTRKRSIEKKNIRVNQGPVTQWVPHTSAFKRKEPPTHPKAQSLGLWESERKVQPQTRSLFDTKTNQGQELL